MKRIIVGVSGASGAVIGERLVSEILGAGHAVRAIVSDGARSVLKEEVGILDFEKYFKKHRLFSLARANDFADEASSGSAPFDAMVIAPCSMSTAGAIAHGITLNLIHRAASVSLKEKRPLIVVPRESPLSVIHLRNLLTLAECGVYVVPATTAFYHKPKTALDLVNFTVGRVLDLLKIQHKLFRRWRGEGKL